MLCWTRDLETVKSVMDVVCLANDCVGSLAEPARRALPDGCRRRDVRDVSDVQWWSERLSEEYWKRRALGLDVEAIQDAWSFFLRASIQIARLSTRERAATP